jgi:hypothetical protein
VEATEMTAVDERGMAKYLDEIEPPEGVKAELLRGVIVLMASPDLVHNLIVLHRGRFLWSGGIPSRPRTWASSVRRACPSRIW